MKRAVLRLKEELIVLFGYSAGLLILAGFFMDREFYPQDTVFWQLKIFIETNIPDIYIRITLGLLLLLLFFLLVRKAYAIGGPGGIIGVGMGFLAGLATPTDLSVGLAMLVIGICCAYVSVYGLRSLNGPQG
ncbi:MAG: hypothetical protein LUO97_05200 [Methanomicrobiales archaeon]|nr:hypothetical protein [Methanomicrobiales archaeon]MDD1669181.1 hypothetical protein [Methanomicrobiales archaeon]